MAQHSQRGKAPDDTRLTPQNRPPIWAEGRQQPKFDLRAFATVAHDIASTDLRPVITRLGAGLTRLGQRVLAGEWRITAPWAARLLPSHQRVGAAILGVQGLIEGAGRLIGPAPVAPQIPPIRAAEPPAPSASPGVEPTLQAIRSALRDLPEVAQPQTAAPSLPAAPTSAHRAGSWLLLRAMMLVALPIGAAKALIHHLEGGDLRDWS